MLMHWMMANPWPSFFGHLFDYYFKQGGGYFGAKKALQPVSIVWDYYAAGDRSLAHVYAVNQTGQPLQNVKATVAFYNIDGTRKVVKEAANISVPAYSSQTALEIPRLPGLSSTYFVRCDLTAADGAPLAENVYWESTTDDDLGPVSNDKQFTTELVKWADLTALNHMPSTPVEAAVTASGTGQRTARITLTNRSRHIAFFIRAEVTKGEDGNEILPITYDDNYITLLPHQSRTIEAHFQASELGGAAPALRVEGYNVPKKLLAIP
jgi:exo-1,4-beta-D-glucosaminidase